METPTKPDLGLKDLGQFYGSQEYHTCWLGTLATDGVDYIMRNGYSWFVTDAVSVIKAEPKVRGRDFYGVKLRVNHDHTAQMVISDGNKTIYTQGYESTTAQIDLDLFFTDNVMMLSSEY